jgi:putative endonuclease
MNTFKNCVYILRDTKNPGRYYTGLTSSVVSRLAAHNAGRCPHTASGGPWEIDVIVEFSDEARAMSFSIKSPREPLTIPDPA